MLRKFAFRLLLIMVLLAVALVCVVLIATRAPEPMPQAMAALQSDSQVLVDTTPWLSFLPRGAEPVTGLIFYPGGLVDPRAYAPMAQSIAAKGYLVVVPSMPLNFAILDVNRAEQVMRAFPRIRQWAMGGHSLGGVSAAMFVKSHPDAVKGLVFWASYPADNDNLTGFDLRVKSIYGTHDGLSTVEKIDASRRLLPASTRWVAIEGGNHGQFGWYGLQSGDGVATISRDEQQAQIVDATVDLLKQIGN
jgi:dienelactone hydrolase